MSLKEKCVILFSILRSSFRFRRALNKKIDKSILLIAHPDDESMFFSPLLYHNKPFILCLSNGNYDGLGHKRENELRNLCEKKGLNYRILNYVDGHDWNLHKITDDITSICKELNIYNIVTFDMNGISGHKNHKSCYEAAYRLKRESNKENPFCLYILISKSIFSKYLFYIPSVSSLFYTIPYFSFFGLCNMLHHQSQMNIVRILWCIFSNYMQINEFIEV